MLSEVEEYKQKAKVLELKMRELDLKSNRQLTDCYSGFHYFTAELEIIVTRIEQDLSQTGASENRLREWFETHGMVAPPKEVMEEDVRNYNQLGLDLKDLYLHTRIFLDVLCKMIKLSYGKRGHLLRENSMKDLLNRKEVARQVDPDFFAGFFERMSWFHDFKKERDDIVHKVARFRFMTDGQGNHHFQLANRFDESWDRIQNNPTRSFVQSTISHLVETVEFLTPRLQFADFVKST